MAHWLLHSKALLKLGGRRSIGFLGWANLGTTVNREEIHALVSVCWWIADLPVILIIIPAVCNGAPVGTGIFHRGRIRALFSSHRGPVETVWFAFSKGWRCSSSSREALTLCRCGWLPLNDSTALDMQIHLKWRGGLEGHFGAWVTYNILDFTALSVTKLYLY